MRLPKTLQTYVGEARSAFSHAPIEVVLGVLLALTFSIAVRQRAGEEWWAHVLVGVVLALPLVFGLSVLRARRTLGANLTWLASAAVLAGAAAYAAWIFDPDLEAEGWRAASLFGAAALALPLVPALGGGEREAVRLRVWAFTIELLLRVAGVLIYAGLLYAALAGAVAAVSTLFELNTPDHLYADLAGIVFFALVPWVVAGGVPALAAAGEAEPDAADGRTAARAASLLGRFLYVPVLGVYLLILYAYTIKVLATGELPKNLLSPIILFAGLAGFLGGVLLEPLRRDPERRGVARLVRVFPLLLLPLLPLAVWAVGVRLAQYGWTEFRYLRFALLLALVLLGVAGAVRLLRRRAPLLVAVPATLAAVLLLSAVGPWSAQAVSRRDQQARLRSGLAEAGLLDADGRLGALPDSTAPARVVPKALYDRISGSATYLYGAHGEAALRPIVPAVERFDNGWALVQALRLEAGCEPQEVRYAMAALPDSAGVAGLPGGTLYRLHAFARDERGRAVAPPSEPANSGALRMQTRGAALVVSGGADATPDEAWRATVDLSALVDRIAARSPDGCGPRYGPHGRELSPADAVRPLVDTAGRERGVLVLTSLGVRWDSTASALVIQDANALAVVR